MYRVKKTFHIAYAHRLMDHPGKCRHLHGHNGLVEVTLAAKKLDRQEMVMDFSELGRTAKKWLDGNLDHKTILSRKDPLLKLLEKDGQPCFAASRNPTAEVLAEEIFRVLKRAGLPVEEVTFWETPSSMAGFRK